MSGLPLCNFVIFALILIELMIWIDETRVVWDMVLDLCWCMWNIVKKIKTIAIVFL